MTHLEKFLRKYQSPEWFKIPLIDEMVLDPSSKIENPTFEDLCDTNYPMLLDTNQQLI